MDKAVSYLYLSHPLAFALMVIITLLSLTTGVGAENPEWIVYNTENSGLPVNEVIEIAVAPAGAIWIGTRSNGLAQFDRETLTVHNTENSRLLSDSVPALAFDVQGDLWIGTAKGLGLFDGQTWYRFTIDLPYESIAALAVGARGEVWIGTGWFYEYGGGLAKFDSKFFKWTVYTTENSKLPNNQILSLALDAQEDVWVGTIGKVAMFDGETWTVYSSNSALPWGTVHALACDTQGTIWIGTYGRGVVRFNGTDWIEYTTKNSGMPNDNIHALTLDAQGILWAGTEHGLAKFDGETWAAYTPDNSGLPYGRIWALASDMQGNLWIGTSGGLAVYREGGVLFPEKATKVEDLAGIWEGWFMGSVAYRQFDADGTLKCAIMKAQNLQDRRLLQYSGRYWFEEGVLKITELLDEAEGISPGSYEVWIRKQDGKAVSLSFYDLGDPDSMRAFDWGKGMTRVEP